MKQVLNAIAALTHPVLLPLFGIAIYHPLVNKYDTTVFILTGVWYFFVYLILPVLYFVKIKKINLLSPDLEQREAIYKTYMAIGIVMSVLSYWMMVEYLPFFIGIFLLHTMLYVLAAIKLKASWHTAAWSFLFLCSLIVKFTNNFVGQFEIITIFGVMLLVVFAVRWKQKAHTLFELGMGLAAGATASTLLLFI
jgi:hypothetical protein